MNQMIEMKKISGIILSILLLSMGFSNNSESLASTVQQETRDIIQELKDIKKSPGINQKSKRNIESTIILLEKSLKDKFWKDESTINLKYGKNVLNLEHKAINKLDKILNNKKESDGIKAKIVKINFRILEVDKILIENSITKLEEIIMSKKSLKKIDNAKVKFEKGNKLLDEGYYQKAKTKYSNAWDQIKNALMDPHFKKIRMMELEGTADMNFDKIPDVYLKIINSTKHNAPKVVKIKITGECVNGIIHDEAAMKIGLSTPVRLSTDFYDEEFQPTNKWFKKHDPDKRINPVIITTEPEYFSFPPSGDDLIQKNPEDEIGSFDFTSSISEIGDQDGWSGKFSFKGEPGDYRLNFFFPLTEPTNEGDSCNFVSSFSIPTTIES